MLRRSLNMFAGALCAFLVWCVIVAVAFWRPTGYSFHPELGRIYRPGIYIHGTEGYSISRINSLGMRSPELSAKRPGDQRVLFLGDSLTEAFQVPADDSFARRVERSLAEKNSRISVVNAGRSGGSPASYLAAADWYVDATAPDVVVVQVSDQDFQDDVTNETRNFFIRKTAGSYEAVYNRDFRSANPLLQRFPFMTPVLDVPVFRLASENVSKALGARADKRPFIPMPAPAAAVAAATPASATAAPEIESDTALIGWVVQELSRRYPNLVILYLPQVDYLGGVLAPNSIRADVRRACEANGVAFADVTDDFQASFDARVAPTGFANTEPGSGHLNDAGHAIVARRLTPIIEAELRP